jgi:serine/threonine-protein kinase
VKICPECRQTFADEHDFCPHHGVKLLVAGPGTIPLPVPESPADMVTVMAAPAYQPENYDRLIGQVLDGRYYLERKLGEGGMGVVFKAHHTVIEKTVAVKILKKEVARDQAVVQRFVQEARAASRIGHGSIVEVTDFGRLPDGSAYSVMEYIEGQTLNLVMKEGPMTMQRALPIIGQIARALAAAHDKGIVHRDLKPENVFVVDRDGRRDLVKIVDFGIAKIMLMPVGANLDGPRLTKVGAVFGTPEYMAPEQAAGRSDNDHRVDVYALGTILYEMLVGRVPHKGETVVATLAQQMLDPITPPRRMNPKADISDKLEVVIMTALAKDRDKRFPTMGDFWVGLEAASGGIPLEPLGGGFSSRAEASAPTPNGIPTFVPREPTDRLRRRASARERETNATVPDLGGASIVELAASRRAAQARRKRLLMVVFGIGAVATAVGVGVAMSRGNRRGEVSSGGDAGTGTGVGVVKVPPAMDAAVSAAVVKTSPPDAGAATSAAVNTPPDAGAKVTAHGPPDAGIVASRPHLPPTSSHEENPIDPNVQFSIKVSTDPVGGSLYIGGEPTQSDGMTIRRPKGTRLEVRCGIPGSDRWEKGHVTLVFNGRGTEVTCKMARKAQCVDDLKSPYPCPEN